MLFSFGAVPFGGGCGRAVRAIRGRTAVPPGQTLIVANALSCLRTRRLDGFSRSGLGCGTQLVVERRAPRRSAGGGGLIHLLSVRVGTRVLRGAAERLPFQEVLLRCLRGPSSILLPTLCVYAVRPGGQSQLSAPAVAMLEGGSTSRWWWQPPGGLPRSGPGRRPFEPTTHSIPRTTSRPARS